MTPYFEDGGSIGTATIYSERDRAADKTVYTTMHPKQIFIGENQFGNVDTVLRYDRIEGIKLVKRFGKEKLSDAIKGSLDNEPYKRHEILHAVYPRSNRDPNKIDPLNKEFASVWLELNNSKVITMGGYRRNPYQVWRYRKNSLETYGRSPCMFALPEIMALNQIGKTLLKAGRLAVEPAFMAPAELEGKVKITPHGFNWFGKDEKRLITPIHTIQNYPIGKDREDRIRDIIEQFLHVDFFLMLTRAPRQMTATEVMERMGEKAALLGSSIGRLNTETLDPNIDSQYDHEYEAGNLPEVLPILQDYGGQHIGVQYQGPLAQIQKSLFRTQGITHGLTALQPLFALYPDSMDNVDGDEAVREVLESYNFPQKAIKSTEEVSAIRAKREELQKIKLLTEQAGVAAEQIKTLAEAGQAGQGLLPEGMPAGLEEMAMAGSA